MRETMLSEDDDFREPAQCASCGRWTKRTMFHLQTQRDYCYPGCEAVRQADATERAAATPTSNPS